MGFFKILLSGNSPKGVREAMRMSYKKHLRLALRGMASMCDDPHQFGLYGALSTRYMSMGIQMSPALEPVVWAELTPFILMTQANAVESLAEYIVYKEMPHAANVPWLEKLINNALRKPPASNESPRTMAPMGIIYQVEWCALLDPDVKIPLEEEARTMVSDLEDK